MRPPPRILLEAAVAVADFGSGDRLSPPPHSTTATPTSAPPQQPCVTHACRWWPYSGSKEFEANAAMVLIILLSALICALGLNATIRCFLRSNISNQSELDQDNNDQRQLAHRRRGAGHGQKNNAVASPCWDGGPTLVYSAEMKAKMAGEEAECAICLSEFVDGEGIRVLRRCQHGFHAPCIQIWLSSHSSCPTCRTTCLPPSPPHPPTPAQSAADDQPSLPESTAV